MRGHTLKIIGSLFTGTVNTCWVRRGVWNAHLPGMKGGVCTGLILCRSCVENHNCSEFMNKMTLPCFEDSILIIVLVASGSCHLSNSYNMTIFSAFGERHVTWIFHLRLSTLQTFIIRILITCKYSY